MIGARNIKGGLVLLSLGLLGGLVMSLYAFTPVVRFGAYDDLPRRLVRLAHISAVMLPLLNIVLGLVLDRVGLSDRWKGVVSWLLLAGAAGLPAALLAEAAFPGAHLPAVPAVAFCLGVFLLTLGMFMNPSSLARPPRRWSAKSSELEVRPK